MQKQIALGGLLTTLLFQVLESLELYCKKDTKIVNDILAT